MSKIIVALLALSLSACAAVSPPQPKQPNERHRVPVNRTQPPELQQLVAQ